MKQPKIIAIKFSDNDFSSTVQAFLKTIRDSGLDKYDLNKENIVELFNRSAHGLYWLVQNKLGYATNGFDPAVYLRITVYNVFLDDEVTEKLKTTNNWCNGEFHILNSKRFRTSVYSV